MLLPSETLLAAIKAEFSRLQSELPGGEASAVQAISVVLQLLLAREQGDVTQLRTQVDALERRGLVNPQAIRRFEG